MPETYQIDTCDPYHETYASAQCGYIKISPAETIRKPFSIKNPHILSSQSS